MVEIKYLPKFRHPKPQDFFDIVSEVSGEDMSWFFEETYNSSQVFDYAVGQVVAKPVRSGRGYHEQNGEYVYQAGASTDDSDSSAYRSTVFVRRWGEAIFPIEIKIAFADGEEIIETWDGQARWQRFDYLKSAKVQQVEVDPQHKLVLDANYSNNTWSRPAPAKVAAGKWASKWMIWLQSLMELFAFFS